jgi:hypothetical protein
VEEERAVTRACARCGAVERVPDGGLPEGWSILTEPNGLRYLCTACVRANARSIEAKLPEEWWE